MKINYACYIFFEKIIGLAYFNVPLMPINKEDCCYTDALYSVSILQSELQKTSFFCYRLLATLYSMIAPLEIHD